MKLEQLSGIGETRIKLFHKLNLYTCEDLCLAFPRRYEDRTNFKQIMNLTDGESVCVKVTIAEPVTHTFVRKGVDLYKTRAFDETGVISLTFFNAPYCQSMLVEGKEYSIYGKAVMQKRFWTMTNPIAEPIEKIGANTGRILPIYSSTKGLAQSHLRMASKQALQRYADGCEDYLPESVREKYELCHLRFALENIHYPQNEEMLAAAHKRLVFEELLLLQLGLARVKNSYVKAKGLLVPPVDLSEFYSALPFELTNGQKQAIGDIQADMASGNQMRRLVQGDVGSGKTAVAAAASVMCRTGQTALMAPTEILAAQHYNGLSELLEPLGVRVGLLTGSVKKSQKQSVMNQLENGEINLIIGTHALLNENVTFKDLRLVITDEQHRFGVRQRMGLHEKTARAHSLVMSATPIPRTLSKIIFGDLDVSVIKDKPPGRKEIETFVVNEGYRERIQRFIRKLTGQGRQVYIVCPLIEDEDGESNLTTVKAYAENLSEKIFPDLNVAFLHGKMKPKEKEAVMAEFASGNTHILVATTVIEVGVNVPNACLMLVENAERFGLSQLHQLRGRVGRGQYDSYCVLFLQTEGEVARKRLEIMRQFSDGFKIAEADLQLRGPGDFFGERQHGLPQCKLADLSNDIELFEETRIAARDIISADPYLTAFENRLLAKKVDALMDSLGKD